MNSYSTRRKCAGLFICTLFYLFNFILPKVGISQIYECEIPEPKFIGTPSTTLCEQYGEEEFVYILGGTGMQKSSDIGSSLAGYIYIEYDFYVDQNFSFLNSIIKIKPGVSIIISSPLTSGGEGGSVSPSQVTLTINNSKLFACEGLWKEIRVYKNKRLNIINSQIEDAETAVNALNAANAIINCSGTTFNRNKIGIELRSFAFGANKFPIIGTFVSNRFKCDAPLNGTAEEISFAGISLINTPISLFANSSARTNYFDGLQFGIHSDQGNVTVQISYAIFTNIQENAIYIKFGSFVANSIRVYDCISHKIKIDKIQNFILNGSLFYFINDGIATQQINCLALFSFSPAAHVAIKNNHFTNLSTTPNRWAIYFAGNDMAGEAKIAITGNTFSNCISEYRGTSTESTRVNWENNTFKKDESLVGAAPLVISSGNKYNVKVIGNDFYAAIANWINSPMGNSNEMSDNNLYNTSVGGAHINITNVKGLKICSNFVMGNFTSRGTNPGTELLDNVFPAASPMIRLQENSVISPQFNAGNKFYPLFIEPTPLMICSTYALALMSTFTVHESQSIYDEIEEEYTHLSLFHPANVVPDDGGYTNHFFFHKSGLEYSYYPCISRALHPDTLDYAIGHQLLDTFFAPAKLFNLNYYLFDLISRDSTVKNSDQVFDDFYELFSDEPEGIMYSFIDSLNKAFEITNLIKSELIDMLEIRDSLYFKISVVDSILITFSDSADYLTAIERKVDYLAEISVTDSIYLYFFEEWHDQRSEKLQGCKDLIELIPNRSEDIAYLKFTWNMYLDNLIDPSSISSADIDTLKMIAGLSENESGLASGIAASLLPICDNLDFESYIVIDNTFIESESNFLVEKVNTNETISAIENDQHKIEIKMFPNPANTEINIVWEDLFIDRILLYDAKGQTVFDKSAKNTNAMIIKDLNTGFYIACLIDNQNKVYCQTFAVKN